MSVLRSRKGLAALLVGFLFGLAAVSLAGRYFAKHSFYKDFTRFHLFLSPESLFFPTASNLRQIVLENSTEEQIIVIIGGSSISHGVGQGSGELWTKHLQNLLGSDFKVFNFALRGGAPTEFSLVAAEALLKQGRKVLYAFDSAPYFSGNPSRLRNQYAYWDAYYKNMLLDYPVRDEFYAQHERRLGQSEDSSFFEELLERKIAFKLDSLLYFTDLWTGIGYTQFFTVWSNLFSGDIKSSLLARKNFADDDAVGVSMLEKMSDQVDDRSSIDLKLVVGRGGHFCEFDQVRSTSRPLVESVDENFKNLPAFFPPLMREISLAFIPYESPFFFKQLTPEQKKCYQVTYEMGKAGYEKHGITSRVVDETGFTANDYGDRVHFVGSGGRKFALIYAEALKKKAMERWGWKE